MSEEYRVYTPPTYLEKAEIMAISGATELVSRRAERDRILLETLWQTGGRLSEVLELIPKRIGDRSLVLRNLKQRPSSPPYKEVFITESLANRLRAYCKEHNIGDDHYVFKPNRKGNGHLSRNYVWWIINKAARTCGVKRVNTRRGDFSWAYETEREGMNQEPSKMQTIGWLLVSNERQSEVEVRLSCIFQPL